MDRARYFRLQAGDEELTADEQKEWHFCWDWDGMLIHKDDREFECCVCVGGRKIVGLDAPLPQAHQLVK